jgi:glycosyltransferase involved in cell wall biosynthesis
MSSSSLVTLVTPTYNQCQFLAETLDSVLAQTHTALEYVVIDDGSTDDTQTVLQSYSTRLRAISQNNCGQAATLNSAWARAQGEYLGYLSSDDLLLPTAVARMVAVLDADPEVVCVFPDSDLIDEQSRVVRRAVCRPFDLETAVVEQECFIGPGALFRSSAFRAAGGWRADMRLAPDREFWIRLAAIGRFEFVRESLARYRTHPKATSFSAASEATSQEYVAVLDGVFNREPVANALQARRDEAYANASMLMARNALWRADFGLAFSHYRAACARHATARGLRPLLLLLRKGASKPVKVLYTRIMRLF